MSHVQVSCSVTEDGGSTGRICDQFEVGLIGNLGYETYDIVIMVTGMPDSLLVE